MTKQQRFETRMRFAEKIMEWGNLGFAAFVFGQGFVKELNISLLLLGIVLFFGAYFFAFSIVKGGVRV